jgi:hypothetical protein|tara:strand:+ start:176 stop:547 length:372 start_codon:yes stop_codon:yes gene_type:complete
MGFKQLFNYMICIFISGLGLFNSTQLEVRYESGTNNELIFQNGQIISTAFMGLFIAAFFVEIMMMRRKTDIVNPSSKKISKSKITKNKKSEISDKDKPSEEESKIEDDIEKAKQLMKEVSLTN